MFTKYQVLSICEPKYELVIDMVDEVIAAAKPGKAAGLDGLMSEHLKFAHPILISVLKNCSIFCSKLVSCLMHWYWSCISNSEEFQYRLWFF